MAGFVGQVAFETISKVYPTGAHVQCSYTMKATHTPSTYDWIGLFKVGWSSPKDFLFYHWVPYPKDKTEDSEHAGSVLFQAGNLPLDDGEFYQFVYFNDKAKMCGASQPFYFRTIRNEEFVEEEMSDYSDMLYITTRRVNLEEKLSASEKECEQLTMTCTTMQREIAELCDQVKARESELAEATKEKQELAARHEVVMQQVKDHESRHEGEIYDYGQLSGEKDKVVEELKVAQQLLSSKEQMISDMQNEIDRCRGEIETLKKEKLLMQEHYSSLELSERRAQEEIAHLRKQMSAGLLDKEAVDTLEVQLRSAQETIERLERKTQQLKELIDTQHDKLQTSEGRHELEAAEICTLQETLNNLSGKVEAVNTHNEELRTKLGKVASDRGDQQTSWELTLQQQIQEKNSLLSTIGQRNAVINRLQAELEEQSTQRSASLMQEDRHVALQTAYDILREDFRDLERKLVTNQRKEAALKEADRQIAGLQDKLRKAHDEWRTMQSQKIKAEKRLLKSSRMGSGSSDTASPPLQRSFSASQSGSSDDLTKEELQKMVEQLSAELETRTQKKDRYKDKYLDEKQRAATMRDYYNGEIERLEKKLTAEKCVSSAGAAPLSPLVPGPVTPIVYPHVPGASGSIKKTASRRRSVKEPTGSGVGRACSLIDEQADAVLLPAPIEPTKPRLSLSRDVADAAAGSRSSPLEETTPHASRPYPSDTIFTSVPRKQEEVVLPRQDDSDEDNDGPDRFHDASDVPVSLQCCMCDKVFASSESVEGRTAHVSEHLDAQMHQDNSSHHQCPMCKKQFLKDVMTDEAFRLHVDTHFTMTQ